MNFTDYTKNIAVDEFRENIGKIMDIYLSYVVPGDYVARSGYWRCKVYPKPRKSTIEKRFQSDVEHSFGAMWWADQISSAFPLSELTKYKERVKDVLMHHDLFESKIGGDIPKTSPKHGQEKDAQELFFAQEYFGQFPNKTRGQSLLTDFRDFQQKKTMFGKTSNAFDYLDCIERGLGYEYTGHEGFLPKKGYELDEAEVAFTGNRRLVDNWAYSMILSLDYFPGRDFFIRIIDETVRYARGERMLWLDNVENYKPW